MSSIYKAAMVASGLFISLATQAAPPAAVWPAGQCPAGQKVGYETTRYSSGNLQTMNLWQCFKVVSFAGKQNFSSSFPGGPALIGTALSSNPAVQKTTTATTMIPSVGADGSPMLAICTPPPATATKGLAVTTSINANGMCASAWQGGSQTSPPSCTVGISAGYPTNTTNTTFAAVCAAVYQPGNKPNPGYVYAQTGGAMGAGGGGGSVSILAAQLAEVWMVASDPACRKANKCPVAPAQ